MRAILLHRLCPLLSFALLGCDAMPTFSLQTLFGGEVEQAPAEPERRPLAAKPSNGPTRTATLVPLPKIDWRAVIREGEEPAAEQRLADTLAAIRQRAGVGEIRALGPWLSRRTIEQLDPKAGGLVPIAPRTLWQRVSGDLREVRFEGGRAVVATEREGHRQTLIFYLEQGRWKLDLLAIRSGTLPPRAQPRVKWPTLRGATADLRGTGPLVAVFETSVGAFRCELREARIPKSVAALVGLARGRVGLPDSDETVRGYYRDGRLRVSPGGPGLLLVPSHPLALGLSDELELGLRFDRAGQLAFWSEQPDAGDGTLIVTLAPRPDLDDRATLLGTCRDLDAIRSMFAALGRGVTLREVGVRRGF